MRSRTLPREFYLRPTLTVARDLIGKIIVRSHRGRLVAARIVEVEAYLDRGDPASHSYRGRTVRNDVMFRSGGLLYVYFTYGMHHCCNVVTEAEGRGCAVLLRAAEPLRGIQIMARRRSLRNDEVRNLCNGPAKLCEALNITRKQNGTDLTGGAIWLEEDEDSNERWPIARSARVGIRNGVEHQWRYYVRDNPFVSPGRPGLSPHTKSQG